MRNYIVLNGKKSTLVTGLLIRSLPSISKPLLRTEIEEIDGRDGDIITPLGYSAYDKEMEIGLYGCYDINDVIRYFDSEGKVTFSNEPDKVYKYKIIEQIDFEKLLRFKTATVTFHVQPFKYSAVSNEITHINQLIDIPDYIGTKNGVTLTASDGAITVTGTATTGTEFYVPVTDLTLEAGNYDLSAFTSGDGTNNSVVRLINSVPSDIDSLGETFLSLAVGQKTSITGELNAESKYHFLWVYIPAGSVNYTAGIQLQAKQIHVFNAGNTKSKPVLTVHGSGVVFLSLNGDVVFRINLTQEFMTIDVPEMEAYKGNTFLNRYVMGDYDALMLEIGDNVISWTGNVTQIDISDVSRWI